MIFFVLFLLLGLGIFLFSIHVFLREDTTLIRKGIDLEDVFDFALYTGLMCLFFARLFFVIFNFDKAFLNPLVFFLFTYFPGLSFSGGLLAAIVFVMYYTQKKRWPLNFFVDYFSMALLISLPIGIIGNYFVSSFSYYYHVLIPTIFILMFIVIKIFIFPRVINKDINQGVVGFIILIIVSFILMVSDIFVNYSNTGQYISIAISPALMIFVASFVNLLRFEFNLFNNK